jgi:uncharacterized protein (DUF934 family)
MPPPSAWNRAMTLGCCYRSSIEWRGYSAARILREAGYTGELRAVGAVFVDQLGHLRRCGFDSFASEHALDPIDAENAFNRWPDVYQATSDGRQPIWAKRHGTAESA